MRLGTERRQRLDSSWQRLSWLLVAGTAAAILLAGILALSFSGGVSRRLQQLRDNAIGLAAGRDLAPPVAGDDEIAELDRAFHHMADSLDEVTRREKAVIEGTTDAIFVKNLDHRYLMMNAAGAAVIGRPVADIIGASNDELIEAESARQIRERDEEVIASGRTITFEYNSTNSAGVERTYLSNRGPFRDRHGAIVGTFGISRDITDQKRAEAALIESDRRFREFFYDAPVGYHEVDPEGRITCVNNTELQILGYTEDEMVGHSDLRIRRGPGGGARDLRRMARRRQTAGHGRGRFPAQERDAGPRAGRLPDDPGRRRAHGRDSGHRCRTSRCASRPRR